MRLTLFIRPLSRKTELLVESDGTLIMNVKAPPSKEKANYEIMKWISKKLRISSSQILIRSGIHSNKKLIEILGVNDNEIIDKLRIHI
ncbi:DUF167 domain-containing protein [[Eubacterium] cellulosolvens]